MKLLILSAFAISCALTQRPGNPGNSDEWPSDIPEVAFYQGPEGDDWPSDIPERLTNYQGLGDEAVRVAEYQGGDEQPHPGDASPSRIESRIINGAMAADGEFPFAVYLNMGCGGTLLSTVWVVTAAHCTYGRSSVTMCAGDLHYSCKNGGQSRSSSKIINHPSYRNGVGPYDISLIKASSPFQFNAKVNFAWLTSWRPGTGEDLISVGWGRDSRTNTASWSKNLKKAGSTTQQCSQGTIDYYNIPAGSTLCVDGTDNGNSDLCQGDSGSFMGFQDQGDWIVVGATSFGPVPACEGPTWYTSVSYFFDWVIDTASAN